MGLWLTLVLGIFILLGAFVVFYTKNSEKFVTFAVALASSVILMLIVVHLLPEVLEIEVVEGWLKYVLILLGVAFGFFFLYVLDKFIPDHDEDPADKEDDQKNLEHIGVMSSVALVLHNIVEGMAIALLASQDVRAAFLSSIGVGLHNIPLGMIIASAFYQQNESRKKTFLALLFVSLSTFIGGLIISFLPVGAYIEIVESISLTLTLGMLFYILFSELLPKMFKSEDKKTSRIGFTLGIVLLIISMLF